jgi:predicted N-acyltransferase
MELKISDETNRENWDAIVERSSNATVFHTWKWLKLMEKYSTLQNTGIRSRVKFYPLLLIEKDLPVGIFPLFFFKKRIFNFSYSPPPNMEIPYLGPLFPDIETMNDEKKQILIIDFQKAIDQFIKKDLKSTYILVNAPPGFENSRSFTWGGYRTIPRHTFYINLHDGKEKIWDNFSKTLKQDINKVKKKGIYIDIGSKKDVEFIYGLLKKRNRIHSNKEYILEIFDTFASKNLTVFIAKHENEPLSGGITICYKNKVSFWVGTPRLSYDGTSPNTYIYWEAINWAIENGYEIFEIMGADENTFPFKRKFKGKLIPYYHMKWFSPSFKLLSSLYYSLKKGDINQLDV